MLDERFAHYVHIFMFSFPVEGGVKRELWEGGGRVKNWGLEAYRFAGVFLLRDSVPHYMSWLFWRGYRIICTYKYLHQKLWLVLFWRRYISFSFIDIGIIIFVTVILRKIKIIFIYVYLRCSKVPKEYSSSICDYFNTFEITSTPHYTRLA